MSPARRRRCSSRATTSRWCRGRPGSAIVIAILTGRTHPSPIASKGGFHESLAQTRRARARRRCRRAVARRGGMGAKRRRRRAHPGASGDLDRAGPSGTAYLLRSIHVLPPQMRWRTPEIDAALDASDVFVFEVPMDDSSKEKVQDFVKDNGLLPPGMALPSMLNEQERKDYTAAIALTHVPPELLTPMRPWLALLTLNAGFIEQQHLSPASGLDRQV